MIPFFLYYVLPEGARSNGEVAHYAQITQTYDKIKETFPDAASRKWLEIKKGVRDNLTSELKATLQFKGLLSYLIQQNWGV